MAEYNSGKLEEENNSGNVKVRANQCPTESLRGNENASCSSVRGERVGNIGTRASFGKKSAKYLNNFR